MKNIKFNWLGTHDAFFLRPVNMNVPPHVTNKINFFINHSINNNKIYLIPTTMARYHTVEVLVVPRTVEFLKYE